MRVCILANAQATHTRRWAEGLAEIGHDVDVISIRDATLRGADVHGPPRWIPAPKGWISSLMGYLYLLTSVRARVGRIEPDVVWAHYSVSHGVIAAARSLTPLVISVWGTDIYAEENRLASFARRLLNGFALRRANAVTATSNFMIPHVQRAVGDPLGHVVTVPFGVDTEAFKPDNQRTEGEASEFIIGFLKGLRRRYDPTNLIIAFSQIVPEVPGARLVIGGSGPLREALESQVHDLGLGSRVDFLGQVDHGSVPAVLKSIDVLVNCSRSESFGVVVLEASAMAKAVVATDVGGIREVLEEGNTGLLVPPSDPGALANAIIALARDPARRKALGRAGRRFVTQNYQWKENVLEMERVLQEAAAKAKDDLSRAPD